MPLQRLLKTVRWETDSQLAIRARRGDTNAFDLLLARYESDLRGFVTRRISAACIEDVLQETRLGAWTNLTQLLPNAPFRAWLFRIAHNKTADHHRQSARHLPLDGEPLSERIADRQSGFANLENRIYVTELLSHLDAEQRLMLELYYADELTLAEIALFLDLNLNTLKYRFYRAHARLTEHINEPATVSENDILFTQQKATR